MARPELTILWDTDDLAVAPGPQAVIPAAVFRTRLLADGIAGQLFRYRGVQIVTSCWETMPFPLLAACVGRGVSRGACRIVARDGPSRPISARLLGQLLSQFLCDLAARRALLVRVRGELEGLAGRARVRRRLDPEGRPLYLRTDLVFGLHCGGSVAHVAGVLNNLDRFTKSPVFVTTEELPTVRADVETWRIRPEPRFRDFRGIRLLHANRACAAAAERASAGKRLAFVYQRYSPYNYAGLRLACAKGVPFVLEYNGSEVWIARHWGRRLNYESLAADIELHNLRGADLVVVVSQPLRQELTERGIDPTKILVNPNGVDPDRYCPDVPGAGVRERYGLMGKTVIGFIGTFELWHGAEVLAEAYGRLLGAHPDYWERVRLLLIGDGTRMPGVKATLRRHGVTPLAVLTGRIRQEEGPEHLAACDVLVSPHVPNPDGSPFFGSPTKLFEYMAMGRAIVASALGQIGEILEHDRTAWMVPPGDAEGLAQGLRRLLDDPPKRRLLGEAARREAVDRHSWREHTRRIVDRLKERCL
jgi:glycosyltransferase involved in cell wall biosynthesis